jgi:hypothetical protein
VSNLFRELLPARKPKLALESNLYSLNISIGPNDRSALGVRKVRKILTKFHEINVVEIVKEASKYFLLKRQQ